MVSLDVTIVNVALPSIRHELQASITELQWAIDGYTLCIASFLMLAGALADRIGRRRTFRAGMVLFGLGSLLCSLAPSMPWLVAARVVQALGGAMLNPVAMSIIVNTFTDPRERAQAIGVWGGVFGISMALGPVVGGTLTHSIGWRSVFWINVPIVLLALFMTARYVPESKSSRPRRLDPVGQLLVMTALATATSAVIEGTRRGWNSPVIIGAFVTAGAAAIALVLYESRRHEPLLDPRFFRSVPFASATVLAVCAFAAFSGFLFLGSLYLQEARGLSAVRAGLFTLPVALMMVTVSPLSGRLVGQGHARLALVGAGLATVVGGFLLTRLRVDTPTVQLLLTFAIVGVGMGLVNPPITNTAVSGMPRAQAGVAAAIASTSRQVGASLGVALAGSIVGHGGGSPEQFTAATHPAWWLVVGYGAVIVALGLASTSAWAKASALRIAPLLEEDAPVPA